MYRALHEAGEQGRMAADKEHSQEWLCHKPMRMLLHPMPEA
jgi:hypothetical protein